MRTLSRRQFLKICGVGLASLAAMRFLTQSGLAQMFAPKSNGRVKKKIKADHDLVAVRGKDPAAITRKAIEALGGMGKFVRPGSTVLVKPNMAWDRTPEYAANTNPAVVATLVQLCFAAGAKRVNVFDNPCNSPERVYENSGIRKAALEKGAKVYFPDSWNVVKAHFNYESPMEGWPIFRDALECDTFINVPVLKHHGSTNLTLGMKNLMGVCAGNRGLMHVDLGRKIADVADFISPDLTVIDAFRYLERHGPSGGNLADVRLLETVIASPDCMLADVYAARFVERDPNTVSYIASAIERGWASPYYANRDIAQLTL